MVLDRLLMSFHVDFPISIILISSQIIVYFRKEEKKRTCRKSWFGFYCGKFMLPRIVIKAMEGESYRTKQA